MDTATLAQLDENHIIPTYGRFLPCLIEGKGCYVNDSDGRRYLDFGAGIGVNSLGYCDDEWQAAICKQAGRLQHASNLYGSEPGFLLAQALCQRTGAHKVFFANSGTEANEGAIKAARHYGLQKHGTGHDAIISLQNSFHGRSYGALSATGQTALQNNFGPMLPNFRYVPQGDLQALEQEFAKGDVCAFFLEFIQGEGGVLPLTPQYLQGVTSLCEKHDILLVADEIQTGLGRTGTLLASEHFGISPDITTLAKGLGAGLPIGAILFNEKSSIALGKGDHGTTFGMNPVACAGANVVLKRLDEAFLQDVQKKGIWLENALHKLPNVLDVKGKGLMWGFGLTEPHSAAKLRESCQERGLLVLLAKDRVRLLPPLIISDSELAEGVSIIKEAIVSFG